MARDQKEKGRASARPWLRLTKRSVAWRQGPLFVYFFVRIGDLLIVFLHVGFGRTGATSKDTTDRSKQNQGNERFHDAYWRAHIGQLPVITGGPETVQAPPFGAQPQEELTTYCDAVGVSPKNLLTATVLVWPSV